MVLNISTEILSELNFCLCHDGVTFTWLITRFPEVPARRIEPAVPSVWLAMCGLVSIILSSSLYRLFPQVIVSPLLQSVAYFTVLICHHCRLSYPHCFETTLLVADRAA